MIHEIVGSLIWTPAQGHPQTLLDWEQIYVDRTDDVWTAERRRHQLCRFLVDSFPRDVLKAIAAGRGTSAQTIEKAARMFEESPRLDRAPGRRP